MSDRDQREVDFDRLNLLGKAVFITGTAVRIMGTVFESVVETVSGIAHEAEKAFRSGLDQNVDDAKILDEQTKPE